MLIEGEGAARAASVVTKPEIENLLAIHDRYVQTETDSNFAVALAENENFHFGVCRLARSPTLFRVVENLWMQFGPTLSYLYDAQARPFHGEAFRRRDPDLARKAISQDILIGGKTLLGKLKA
jgi:DNA-binding GntR family transcriptional regulator